MALEGLKIELINYGIKISYGTFVSSSSRELDPVIMVLTTSKVIYSTCLRNSISSPRLNKNGCSLFFRYKTIPTGK